MAAPNRNLQPRNGTRSRATKPRPRRMMFCPSSEMIDEGRQPETVTVTVGDQVISAYVYSAAHSTEERVFRLIDELYQQARETPITITRSELVEAVGVCERSISEALSRLRAASRLVSTRHGHKIYYQTITQPHQPELVSVAAISSRPPPAQSPRTHREDAAQSPRTSHRAPTGKTPRSHRAPTGKTPRSHRAPTGKTPRSHRAPTRKTPRSHRAPTRKTPRKSPCSVARGVALARCCPRKLDLSKLLLCPVRPTTALVATSPALCFGTPPQGSFMRQASAN